MTDRGSEAPPTATGRSRTEAGQRIRCNGLRAPAMPRCRRASRPAHPDTAPGAPTFSRLCAHLALTRAPMDSGRAKPTASRRSGPSTSAAGAVSGCALTADLITRRKSDPAKLGMAARLRSQTTLPFVIRHSSFVIRHSSFPRPSALDPLPPRHAPLDTRHSGRETDRTTIRGTALALFRAVAGGGAGTGGGPWGAARGGQTGPVVGGVSPAA